MRIFLTGHRGYIGVVLTRVLQEAGHEVVGCDTDLYERCTFAPGGRIPEVASLRKDIRELEVADLLGFDAVAHLAGLSNDPLGDLNPAVTYDINHHASARLATIAKQAGVGRFVFSSSCSTYGRAGDDFIDETGEIRFVTPYGEFEGAGGARHLRAGRRRLLPDFPSLRDRLRGLAANPLRPGAEQPGCLGGDDRPHPDEVRRDPMASDRPHRGHLAGLPGGAGSRAGQGPERGVQRRHHLAELPDPRSRRDRRPGGARLPHRLCGRRRSRSALLPGELRQDQPGPAGLQAGLGRGEGRPGDLRVPIGRPISPSRNSRARAISASPISAS